MAVCFLHMTLYIQTYSPTIQPSAIKSLFTEDAMDEGNRIIRAGLEGGKPVIAYSKPALEKSASLAGQVGIHLFVFRDGSDQCQYL